MGKNRRSLSSTVICQVKRTAQRYSSRDVMSSLVLSSDALVCLCFAILWNLRPVDLSTATVVSSSLISQSIF